LRASRSASFAGRFNELKKHGNEVNLSLPQRHPNVEMKLVFIFSSLSLMYGYKKFLRDPGR
jgi:hypothetical protein